MRRSIISQASRRAGGTAALCAVIIIAGFATPSGQSARGGSTRPKISVRVTPPIGVAPLRIVATAELSGGADDFEEYYCARVRWEWADETRSETADDCNPYEAGKSEIRRRFTQQHTYRDPGVYQIIFQLRQGTKVVGAATIKIEVRGG